MESTDQPEKASEIPQFTGHGEGDTDLLPPSEHTYTQNGLATEFDNISGVTQHAFPILQQDNGDFEGQNRFSWQPQDLTQSSFDATTFSLENPTQPLDWPWQTLPSSWSLQDQNQDIWPHHLEAGLGEVPPIWELGQGTVSALQLPPNVQIQPNCLPRRRSRYLRNSALPIVSGSNPVQISGSGTLVESAMDPIQRWRNSPPETEAASLVAIADALRNNPLRAPASTSTGSLNSRRMDVRPGSTVSFTSGSSLSSGSATSASSVARRGRVSKRTRPNAAKGKAAEKRKFPCTFCCDSFKSKFDWARHEQSLHLSIKGWRCAPYGSVVVSAATGLSSCAYCGLADPTPTHMEDHDINLCRQTQIYSRKDHLIQHLRCIHHVQDPPPIESWKVEGPPVASNCGFCDLRMESWQERTDHLVSHFRKGKTMEDWRGDHGFEPGIAAQVTNAIPPYLIASESRTYAPFSAAAPNPTTAEHVQQITRSAEESFEAWNGLEMPPEAGEPMMSLQDKSFPELFAFHLGRFAQHQMRLGIIPTDKMFQDEARRLQFGTVDPLDDTVADNEEWLARFRNQHIGDSADNRDSQE
ncbi:hypothetical protein FOPG_08206 [Fusarium oxysporum f. sp. conglutinans race 2 54008]|nr:hypothetical protein FOPG_08206 [Fusarium oxysporum f. sp. conglutinans race 2 54008]KAF6514963.1 hypothetical protein HZS61_006097 [Fusarium oxysporum f. sp. conglutinans]KAG7003028.1 hypothetical protein FocnCong_v001323 [Fusarium oxysporum f. sp. conglutinans]KAI8400017.1 hypothetical protein FOFC_18836 [Fusarium oxysporum]